MAPKIYHHIFRTVDPGHAGMYVCFVTSPRGGFDYRSAFLAVIPSKSHVVSTECWSNQIHPGIQASESPFILILVVCLSMVVLGVLLAVITCVVRRRSKESLTPPDTAEVTNPSKLKVLNLL